MNTFTNTLSGIRRPRPCGGVLRREPSSVLGGQEQNQSSGVGCAEGGGHRFGAHAVVAQRAGGLPAHPGGDPLQPTGGAQRGQRRVGRVAVSCSAVSTRSTASGTAASRTTDRCAVQSASGPVRSTSASYKGWSPVVSQSRGY